MILFFKIMIWGFLLNYIPVHNDCYLKQNKTKTWSQNSIYGIVICV